MGNIITIAETHVLSDLALVTLWFPVSCILAKYSLPNPQKWLHLCLKLAFTSGKIPQFS